MKQLEELDVIIWRMFALLMVGVMIISLVKAITGRGVFPWWHLATLAIAWKMGDCSSAFQAILAKVQRFVRRGCATLAGVTSRVKSAAKDYSLARKQGRLRRVPALFNETTKKAA